MTIRLGDVASGRANNVLPLRYVAAAGVMVFHAYTFSGRVADDPLLRALPPMNSGSLGIKTFFLLSGFLVTKSYLERGALVPFVAARVLRIYPALVAAVLFTIAVAAVSSTLPLAQFLASPVTIEYLWSNALGWKVRFELPGAFATNPFPGGVNGSLWTIPVELRLYAAVALLGVAGLLARPRAFAAAAALLMAAIVAAPDLVVFASDALVRELVALFLLGALAWVHRDRVPLSLAAAALALAAIVVDPGGVIRGGWALQPLVAYLVLTAAYHPALQVRPLQAIPDASYGLYVYAFPIQQLVVWTIPGISPWPALAIAMPATLALALASWRFLERPMLARKASFARPASLARG